MNKFVLVALGALACGANALYRFRLNLPDPCDVVMISDIKLGDTKLQYFHRFHGSFMYLNSTFLTGAPIQDIVLMRPDYAEQGKVKSYTWTNYEDDKCEASEQPSTNIFDSLDMFFTNKEPAVYHGVECTVMYNATNSDEERFYVDESAGTLIGATAGEDMDQTFRFIKAFDNKPEKFVFDKKVQTACDGDSFVPPKQAAYDAACKRSAINFNALLRSFAKKH